MDIDEKSIRLYIFKHYFEIIHLYFIMISL